MLVAFLFAPVWSCSVRVAFSPSSSRSASSSDPLSFSESLSCFATCLRTRLLRIVYTDNKLKSDQTNLIDVTWIVSIIVVKYWTKMVASLSQNWNGWRGRLKSWNRERLGRVNMDVKTYLFTLNADLAGLVLILRHEVFWWILHEIVRSCVHLHFRLSLTAWKNLVFIFGYFLLCHNKCCIGLLHYTNKFLIRMFILKEGDRTYILGVTL